MKVSVVYNTTDAPHGGGNQFIKALKARFASYGILSSEADADIILFNSHHNIDKILGLKKSFPDKKFVHRVDGPMKLYNNMSDTRDDLVYNINSAVADGTIFQSEWSKKANIEMGFLDKKPSAVILNGVDDTIFFEADERAYFKKTRIISASYSPNMKKGFKLFQFLDSTLDFDNFEYCFAGNSPVKFKNIKTVGCLKSNELANKLRDSDLFITASEKDPCSNSLIEAIACGLNILALNDGGHPEIIQNTGCLFDNGEDLLKKLINQKFDKAKSKLSIDDSAKNYVSFFNLLCAS